MSGEPLEEAVNQPDLPVGDSSQVSATQDGHVERMNNGWSEDDSAGGSEVANWSSREGREEVKEMVQYMEGHNFDSNEERERFIHCWRHRLKPSPKNNPTPLHILADLPDTSSTEFVGLVCRKFPDLMKVKDSHGRTPLLQAIYRGNYGLVETMCESFNDIDSILRIEGEYGETCLHTAIREECPADMTLELIRRASEETLCAQDREGCTPLHLAVHYRLCTESQLEIVVELMTRADRALSVLTHEGLSVYQYHLQTKRKSEASLESGQKSDKVSRVSAARIEEELLLQYLRTSFSTRTKEQALRLLLGHNPEELRLWFEPPTPKTPLTLEMLTNPFRSEKFMRVLRHVALDGRALMQPMEDSLQKYHRGCSEVVDLFRWLAQAKDVRHILKVAVDDLVEPHSDEAVFAVCEFNVEILDWRSIDLCPEAIAQVGRRLTELHLYWSGKNAVLRAWSEPEGLPRLNQLRVVHLHLQLDKTEYPERTRENIQIFRERFAALRPDIAIHIVDKGSPLVSTPTMPMGDLRPVESWLESIDNFNMAISNLPDPEPDFRDDQIEPVRVALIDDGVDIYHRSLARIISCQTSQISDKSRGTAMALAISRICPFVQLKFFQLQTVPTGDSEIQYSPGSAAEAIISAIEQRVDIICMAWTIPGNSNETDKLRAAVQDAAKDGVLMFCKASDTGYLEYYPACLKSTFRIRASKPFLSDRPRDMADFAFPGNIQMDELGELSGSTAWTGSPLATALATGLAALILYCGRLALEQDGQRQGVSRAGRPVEFDGLRRDSIRSAFHAMNTNLIESGDKIAGWEYFGRAAKAESLKIALDIITELVPQLRRLEPRNP